MDPKYIEVFGEFTPRGGIAIHPFANYGKAGTEFEALHANACLSTMHNNPIQTA